MKKIFILLIVLITSNILLAQSPFYGDRMFVSRDTQDTLYLRFENDSIKFISSVGSTLAQYGETYFNDNVYMNELYVRDTLLRDLIVKYAAGDVVNIGSANQIPFVNALGTDLAYSPNFTWNDTVFEIQSGYQNIFIGYDVANNSNINDETTNYNTIIGYGAGKEVYNSSNTMLGHYSGMSTTVGVGNVFIGRSSGESNIIGSSNTFLGTNAGFSSIGSLNVFIGNEAGYNETGSNKLYIENSSGTPLIYGDFANDSLVINGNANITGNLTVGQLLIHDKYEAAAYLDPDSTITTSATTTFSFLGGGANNKFSNIYAEGFSFDGDTLQFDQAAYDYRDSVEFNIDYSCATATGSVNRTITYGIMIKSVGETTYTEYRPTSRKVRTQTAGIYYSGAICTTMPIFLKDGDKIWIVAKCATNTATVSTQDFGIYLREQ